jgi:hypothetical protein
MLTLNEICAVLGCSKPAASLLKNGKYDREGDLVKRYQALVGAIEKNRGISHSQICIECPRQDCEGCRLAEI